MHFIHICTCSIIYCIVTTCLVCCESKSHQSFCSHIVYPFPFICNYQHSSLLFFEITSFIQSVFANNQSFNCSSIILFFLDSTEKGIRFPFWFKITLHVFNMFHVSTKYLVKFLVQLLFVFLKVGVSTLIFLSSFFILFFYGNTAKFILNRYHSKDKLDQLFKRD